MKFITKASVFIAFAIYFLFLILYLTKFHYGLSSDTNKWGTFGDFIGGSLNPVLGILTIVLTYDIIKNQIIENKQSEFKYMFQLLFDTLEDNKDIIKYERFGKIYTGREAIAIININIENLYQSLNQIENSNKDENFNTAFWSVFEDIDGSSSTYMKTLHNSLKVIDQNCLNIRKSTYADLLRAQLHFEELKFILFNGIASDEFRAFKQRLEKFSILKDLNGNNDIDNNIKSKYEKIAFNEKEKMSIKSGKVFGYEINLQIKRII